jgi:hypothetical protein
MYFQMISQTFRLNRNNTSAKCFGTWSTSGKVVAHKRHGPMVRGARSRRNRPAHRGCGTANRSRCTASGRERESRLENIPAESAFPRFGLYLFCAIGTLLCWSGSRRRHDRRLRIFRVPGEYDSVIAGHRRRESQLALATWTPSGVLSDFAVTAGAFIFASGCECHCKANRSERKTDTHPQAAARTAVRCDKRGTYATRNPEDKHNFHGGLFVPWRPNQVYWFWVGFVEIGYFFPDHITRLF